ncbi:DUF3488 and transglutaminase-like domain-containing protein [Microlunatus panaciterrae]|uniref:Transglutaminase-like putative cysteine protease n=1 Tax=Microlunatus panaciterrae TaxID=400768 RepID=A0ABS2RNF9_9ACTN|nr:DUF3488 and transglutaminase-like domain-containing protein [Microlunatus panaciterrae]MBM7800193.1 transglutaminase-like putative cysteine protease [Microlunatus panaciterrae]
MHATDRSGIAVAVSVMLATFALTPLTKDSSFLGVSWVVIIALGVVAVLMRRARLSAPAVLVAQLLLLGVVLVALSLTMPAPAAPWYEHFFGLYGAGAEHMRTQASPMDPDNGVKLIFVSAIGVIAVMTDLLVSGIRRPVWAIAPPATLFLVPAIGLGTDTGLISFGCLAVGYLGILVAEGLNSTARWTRGLSRDSAEGMGTAAPVVWRSAGYIAVPAVVLTVALGVIMPTLSLPGWGLGSGQGGSGPLELADPTLDLRRNLNQPTDRQVMSYTTDRPGGVYLRMASLPKFSDAGWQVATIRLDRGDQLPAVPGLRQEPAKRRTTTITVGDFRSEYLPLPYAPRRIQVAGQWGSDEQSLVVHSTRSGSGIRNLTYTVESVDIDPSGEDLAQASAGTPTDSALTSVVPNDLPDSLVKLTRQVTANAPTPALKAAAIQAYLRSARFTYSTEPQPGTGYQALENFLLKDRRGYCEQFAGSMAMMARVVGIPSRVAVGFLPGDRQGDTFKVSVRDMHAWPELYFSGFGWVRFEPTPAVASAPSWTVRGPSDAGEDPTSRPSSTSPTQRASAGPNPTVAPTQGPTTGDSTAGFPWRKTLTGSGIALLVLLILASPATIRIRRRSARMADGLMPDERVEAAWAEIKDTLVDLGGSWPEGSPRMIGTEVATRLHQDKSATLTQVATLVERARYSRSFDDPASVQNINQMTDEIRRGLAEPRSGWQRLWAFVAPRSLFRGLFRARD